jgi:exopolyphosphatase/pppGpp-phosphohydrolase
MSNPEPARSCEVQYRESRNGKCPADVRRVTSALIRCRAWDLPRANAFVGRDTFASGAIRASTIDVALTALDNFRHILGSYGVREVWAIATSAVREARNVDVFLDRIQRRTAISFEIVNEAEEGRPCSRTRSKRDGSVLTACIAGGIRHQAKLHSERRDTSWRKRGGSHR